MAKGPIKQKIKRIPGQIRLKGISGIAVKPTAQQIKIAEGLAKGLSKKEALTAAGISESNARSNSAELVNQPGVRKALDDALRMAGVNVEKIAQVLREGLDAKKIISATLITCSAQPEIIDGSEVVIDKNSSIIGQRFLSVEDHAVRHKFLETALEIKDLYPSVEVEGGKGKLSVTIRRGN